MANWQNVMIDTDSIDSGKFYYIEINKDLVPNLREVDYLLQPVSDIDSIKLSISDLQKSTNILNNNVSHNQTKTLENLELIHDNQGRINNLENQDLAKKFLIGLDYSNIKFNYSNEIHFEINLNRTPTSYKVYKLEEDSPLNERSFKDITSGVSIVYKETLNDNNEVISKKLIIDSNSPISGYVMVL